GKASARRKSSKAGAVVTKGLAPPPQTPARSPRPATGTRRATTTTSEWCAPTAPPPLPARAQRRDWPPSSAHQVQPFEQGNRHDSADATLPPEPVVNDNDPCRRPLVKRVAVAFER